MADVIRTYRQDPSVIVDKSDKDDALESRTNPSDQTNGIGPKVTTMFELTFMCDAGCGGSHRQCSYVFLFKCPDV